MTTDSPVPNLLGAINVFHQIRRDHPSPKIRKQADRVVDQARKLVDLVTLYDAEETIRAWAAANDVPCPPVGRVPYSVVAAYQASS